MFDLLTHAPGIKLNRAEPNFIEFTGLLHYTKKKQLLPPQNQGGVSAVEDMDVRSSLEDQPPLQYHPGLDLVHFLPPMPIRPPLLGRFPSKKALRPSKEPDAITQTYQQIQRSQHQAASWRRFVDKHGVLPIDYLSILLVYARP